MNIDRKILEDLLNGSSVTRNELFYKFKESLYQDDVETHQKNGGDVEWTPKGCKNSWSKKVHQVDFDWKTKDYRIKEQTLSDRRDELVKELNGPIQTDLECRTVAFLKGLEL